MNDRHRYYYVATSDDGPTKIGMSYQPDMRIPNLRREVGNAVRLFWQSPEDWKSAHLAHDAVETAACESLIEHHAFGEWFHVTPERAVLALTIAMENNQKNGEPRGMISRSKAFTTNSATKKIG